MPYVLGAGGLVGVGLVAVRWSRRSAETIDREPAQSRSAELTDAAIEARLDDELSDLD